jgi:hypothetical protein
MAVERQIVNAILIALAICLQSCYIADASCFRMDPTCQPWGPLLFTGKTTNLTGISRIYFLTGTGLIERFDVAGSGIVTVRSGLNTPVSIAYGAEMLFWTDNAAEVHRLDSAGVHTQIASAYYGGISYFSQNDFVYGAEVGAGEIRRFRRDGSEESTVHFSAGTQEDSRLVMDPTGQYAYQSSGTAGSDGIRRLTLDGGASIATLVSGNNDPSGFCADFNTETMCWVERTGQRLQCSRLDGSNIVQILGGLNEPRSLVCDFTFGYYYIGEGTGNRILRTDNSGSITQLFSGFSVIDMVGVR